MNLENLDVFNGVWATSLVFGDSHKMLKERAMKELTTLGIPSRSFFYPLSSMPVYERNSYYINRAMQLVFLRL